MPPRRFTGGLDSSFYKKLAVVSFTTGCFFEVLFQQSGAYEALDRITEGHRIESEEFIEEVRADYYQKHPERVAKHEQKRQRHDDAKSA
ncbi:unnamed protein product [Pedinophyceae sp. YPF-701]|nr:unnamed protein product [Pedinophyceae sp. YPF-701]